MEERLCPSCATELPERAYYCPNCAKQVRCRNCRDVLEPDAHACVMCGTLVGEGDRDEINNNFTASPPASNTIEFRETAKSRALRATFTDKVGNGLNETLNLLIANRVRTEQDWNQRTQFYDPGVEPQKQLPTPVELSEPHNIPEPSVQDEEHIPVEIAEDLDRVRKIFRFDDDRLTLIETRLKASNKLDFARRLTFLFLYAQELRSHGKVQRADLNDILKQAEVLDSNTRAWIRDSPDLLLDGNSVELRVSGRERAIEILNEFFDPNASDSWKLGAPPRKRRSKRDVNKNSKITEETVKSSSRKRSGSTPKSSSPSRAGRPTPTTVLNDLISQGFFSERRTISDIVSHCQSSMAYQYKANQLSPVLIRLVQDKQLNRKRNADGQYEYFT